MNGWDPAPMERLLADPRFLNIEGQKGTHAELRERMQRGDRRTAAALARARCRRRQFITPSRSACSSIASAGADEIVLHGTTTGPARAFGTSLWPSSELPSARPLDARERAACADALARGAAEITRPEDHGLAFRRGRQLGGYLFRGGERRSATARAETCSW